MIDCENEVYTRVATALRGSYSGIDITGDYVNIPSGFPHVSIVQIDNRTVKDKTTDTAEMARVVFQMDIYANDKSGKKATAKAIAKTIDDEMFRMNFRRTGLDPNPNRDDLTIFRLTARYEGETDGKNFYRS